MGSLLDHSPFEDLKTSKLLLELIQSGFVEG
jgi:hypothetical protein